MGSKKKNGPDIVDLQSSFQAPDSMAANSPEAAAYLIRELRMHQHELERQNEEFRQSQEALRRSAVIQDVLREIAEAVVRESSLTELYKTIHRLMKRVLPAQNLYISLLDEARGLIVRSYCVDEENLVPLTRPIGKGLSEYFMQMGQTVHVTSELFTRLRESGEVNLYFAPVFECIGAPLRDSKGKIFGVITLYLTEEMQPFEPEDSKVLSIVAAQVSLAIERKQAEETLAAERNLLVTLIDTIPDRIFVKDKECRFTLNNVAHIKALGANSQSEVIGKTDRDFRPAELSDFYYADDQNVIINNKPLYDYEEPSRLPSGEMGTLLISKAPLHNSTGEVIGLVGISRDISDRKHMEQELRMHAYRMEEMVERRTQELFAANQELMAANEELTDLNEKMSAMNESLEAANQTLTIEIDIRQQKEQEVLLREKQYRATTSLLTSPAEDVHELMESILHEAVLLVGAPGGYIGLIDESGRNSIIRYAFGASRALYMLARSVNEGILGEVYRSGEILLVEDYRHYPHRIIGSLIDNLTTVLMMPLKQGGEVTGVLAANWQNDVHPVTTEDIEIFRQFGILASIALERARASKQILYQNQLLLRLAETTASLVNELDLDKALQNILNQAISFMGIPHGFIQLFELGGRQANIKCGLGRYESLTGQPMRFEGRGIFAEILRTGKSVVINDYANWPQRLDGALNGDITAEMQAPLNIDGKTIGSIGLTIFDELFSIDPAKLAVFEQFATVAAIAVKNAMAHQKTNHLAFHDALTGLPNRAHLNRRLEEEMKRARRGESVGAVMFIDLDDLKTINDSFGHSCGDNVIKAAASQISGTVGQDAFLARVGGDEFIVILPGEENLKHIARIANRLVSESHREYEVGGQNIHMSASVGVTFYPGDGDIAEEILKNADNAMYAAKAAGKNCWRFYEPEMLKDAYEKLVVTNDLRHALERNELCLHYQPQIAIGSEKIIGFEALLRWDSPEHGKVPPSRFIPLAEQSGLIIPIGQWVIREACRFAQKLAKMNRKDVRVAVNVSPRQLAAPDFVEMVRRCIEEGGIAAEQLEMEITENVLIDSLEDSTNKLVELNAMGIRLSLDDFGTGFSSLTYLRNLPVKTLKIDKSFIDKISDDKVQEGFIRSIIEMAHVLGLYVIAEGVETEQQLMKLTQFGCDCVQGYVFSKPVPQEEAINFSVRLGRKIPLDLMK